MDTQPSLKKNIAISTLYQILLIILPIVTAPYIARVLGPDQSGVYDYTTSIMTYFAMFAALGTASYGVREIARVRDDAAMRSKLFWEIELMTVMTSSACIVVWFIFIALTPQYKTIYLVLTMGLLSTMFDISWFFAGMEQFKYTVTKNAACKLIGVILMFLFVKKQEDLLLYVIIIISSTMIGNLSMWLYVPRFVEKVDFRTFTFRKHFHETLIYFVPTVATSVYTVLDRTLIGVITNNKAENGCYHYAMQIVNMMKALTFSSLNMVLGSRLSFLFAEKKYDEIKEKIADSTNYILFMGLGICFGMIGVAKRFVPVFLGAGYDRVVTMLILMSPIVIIIGISNCLGSQYYTPAGYRKLSARYIIIGAVVNFLLNLVLIPKFWGYGAIVASLIAEGAITILYLKNCNGYLRVSTIIKDSWKKLIAGLIMLIVIKVLDVIISSDIAALFVEVAVGFTVYLTVVTLLRDSFMTDLVMGKILKRKR